MNSELSFLTTLAQLAANPSSVTLRGEVARLFANEGPSSRHRLFLAEILSQAGPEIDLEKEGDLVATFNLGFGGPQATSHILPGRYLLRLSTGRVLWEAALTESDLLRTFADSLPLAAASEETQPLFSREEPLAGGAIILRVIPGFQGGSIRLEEKEAP